MKLENQVVSLELSKQLKEAGYKQEGLWWWIKGKSDKEIGLMQGKPEKSTMLKLDKPVGKQHFIQEIIVLAVAPTVAELGEKLPASIKINNPKKELTNNGVWAEEARLVIGQFKAPMKAWYCDYHIYRPKPFTQFELYKGFKSDTEADARAKMWLYLKKEGLL